jgi:hypothetical protein
VVRPRKSGVTPTEPPGRQGEGLPHAALRMHIDKPRVSGKTSSRKLAEQARLHTPRYRTGMRVYESGFPRMSLLGNRVIKVAQLLSRGPAAGPRRTALPLKGSQLSSYHVGEKPTKTEVETWTPKASESGWR